MYVRGVQVWCTAVALSRSHCCVHDPPGCHNMRSTSRVRDDTSAAWSLYVHNIRGMGNTQCGTISLLRAKNREYAPSVCVRS